MTAIGWLIGGKCVIFVHQCRFGTSGHQVVWLTAKSPRRKGNEFRVSQFYLQKKKNPPLLVVSRSAFCARPAWDWPKGKGKKKETERQRPWAVHSIASGVEKHGCQWVGVDNEKYSSMLGIPE